MDQLTDRIAGVSPQTILIIVAVLTATRAALGTTRVAAGRFISELLESVLIALVLVFLILRPFVAQTFFIPSGSMHPTLWEGDRILVDKWGYRVGSPQRGDVIVFRAPRSASPDEKDFIKRLVGLPGDVIEVKEGYVQIGDGPRSTLYTRNEVRSVLGAGRSVSDPTSAPPLRLTTDAIWLGARRVTKEEFARAANRTEGRVFIVPGKVLRNHVMLCECFVAEDPAYRYAPEVVPPGHLFVMGDNRNESHDSHKWGMLPANRVIGRAELVFWPPGRIKRIARDDGSE